MPKCKSDSPFLCCPLQFYTANRSVTLLKERSWGSSLIKRQDALARLKSKLDQALFDPIQPRYLLTMTRVKEVAYNDGSFLRTIYDGFIQQPQSRFPILRGMCNQSMLDDVVIIVLNTGVRPRPTLPEDPGDAGGELLDTMFGSMDSVG